MDRGKEDLTRRCTWTCLCAHTRFGFIRKTRCRFSLDGRGKRLMGSGIKGEREDLWMDHAGNRDRRRDDSDADMRRFSSTEEAKRRYNCGSPRHREDRRKILAELRY